MLGGGGAGGMFTSKAGGTGLGLSLGQVRTYVGAWMHSGLPAYSGIGSACAKV